MTGKKGERKREEMRREQNRSREGKNKEEKGNCLIGSMRTLRHDDNSISTVPSISEKDRGGNEGRIRKTGKEKKRRGREIKGKIQPQK